MWRTKVRAFLTRSSNRLHRPIQHHQVPAEALTLAPSFTPISSIWLSPTASHCRNPRLLCSGTNPSFDFKESHEPSCPENLEVGIDGNTASGETPDSISLDEDAPLIDSAADAPIWTFDDEDERDDAVGGNPSSVLDSSGGPSLGIDDRVETEVEGDSLSSLWEGSINGDDDPMSAAEAREIDSEQMGNVLALLQTALQEPLDLSLDKMELTLSEEFVAMVIQSPNVSRENLIGFFRWASEYDESVKTSRVVELLVRAVSRTNEDLSKKDAYMLWDLAKEIGKERGLLTTDILNQLISMFRELGKAKAAHEVFDKFTEFGCDPNGDTYYLTIEALGKRSMFDAAWSVCEKMLDSRCFPDSEKIGEIITFFCRGNKAKEAHSVYSKAKENNSYPPRSSLDFLIGGLLRKGANIRKAVKLLKDYSGDSLKSANETFSSVVRGLCRIKDLKEAKELLFRMVDSGPPPGNAAFNYVITALSKEGDIEDAIALVRVMEGRGLRPDVYTYSVIMSGFAKGGLMDEAYKIFCEAKKRHPKLTPVTYHILIRGYCKMEEYDRALECLKEMKEDGLRPNADEYNKIIQSLCLKALDWRTAEKLSEEMKESGLHLKGLTRSLIASVKELEEEEMPKEVVQLEA